MRTPIVTVPSTSLSSTSFQVLSFLSIGDWTQSPTHARQAGYHRATNLFIFSFIKVWDRVSFGSPGRKYSPTLAYQLANIAPSGLVCVLLYWYLYFFKKIFMTSPWFLVARGKSLWTLFWRKEKKRWEFCRIGPFTQTSEWVSIKAGSSFYKDRGSQEV